jgi:dolichol kinase
VAGGLAAIALLPIALVLGDPGRLAWAALGGLLGLLGGLLGTFVGDRSDRSPSHAGVTLLACLGWSAGWLWPAGGALVAAWIVAVVMVAALAGAKRAPFALFFAGSVVAVLTAALINRP